MRSKFWMIQSIDHQDKFNRMEQQFLRIKDCVVKKGLEITRGMRLDIKANDCESYLSIDIVFDKRGPHVVATITNVFGDDSLVERGYDLKDVIDRLVDFYNRFCMNFPFPSVYDEAAKWSNEVPK